MSLRRRTIDAAFWGAAQKWGHHGVRLLVFAVLVRLLDPESFGLVALAGVFILLGEQLVDQGFNDALVQRRTLGPAHLDAAFWTAVGGGVLLMALLLAAAQPVAVIFDQPRLAGVLTVLAPSLLLAAVGRTHEAILRRRLAFRPIAGIGLVSVVAGGIAGLTMAWTGHGVWSLVGQLLAQRLVEAPCFWWASGWRPRPRFSYRHFRALVGFGTSVTGMNLLNFANRQMDHLLIGYFLGATALGFYTVGYRLVRILLDLLPHALMPVALSAFARLQAEPERLRQVLYESTRLLALAAFPAFAGVGLVAPEMVPALFGEKWQPSVPVLQALVPIGLLQSASLLFPTVLKSIGRPGRALTLAGINAGANALAFLIAVQWGIVAVAAAYSARGILLWPLAWYMLSRSTGTRLAPYGRALAPAVAATAVMMLAVELGQVLMPAGLSATTVFVASVALGVATYAVAACLAAPDLYRRGRAILAARTLIYREQGDGG